jgi:hypothetical protein
MTCRVCGCQSYHKILAWEVFYSRFNRAQFIGRPFDSTISKETLTAHSRCYRGATSQRKHVDTMGVASLQALAQMPH